MKEVIENDIPYIIEGDYPDGKYCKHIKNKGDSKKRMNIFDKIDILENKIESLIKDLKKKGVTV